MAAFFCASFFAILSGFFLGDDVHDLAAGRIDDQNIVARYLVCFCCCSPATYVRGAFFLSFRAYIHVADAMGPHFCARSSFNQHRNEGVVSEQTRRKGDIVTDSKEALKKRADARFKKDERVREGTKAMLDYEAEGRAVREKTARLRALRLDKEAAEKNEGVAADSGQPLGARKKANHGC